MAKDVLNKSKLSAEEDRIMRKVLACKQYKPSKGYIWLSWVGRYFNDRLKFAVILASLSFISSLCTSACTVTGIIDVVVLVLIYLGGVVLAYTLSWCIMPDYIVKWALKLGRR